MMIRDGREACEHVCDMMIMTIRGFSYQIQREQWISLSLPYCIICHRENLGDYARERDLSVCLLRGN